MLVMMNDRRGVVVTGGAGGIGSAVINRFRTAGWSCCSIDVVKVSGGDQTFSVQADLRTAQACRDAIAEAVKHLGRLDAGLGHKPLVVHEVALAATPLHLAIPHQGSEHTVPVAAGRGELVEQPATFFEHLRQRVELIAAPQPLDVFQS